MAPAAAIVSNLPVAGWHRREQAKAQHDCMHRIQWDSLCGNGDSLSGISDRPPLRTSGNRAENSKLPVGSWRQCTVTKFGCAAGFAGKNLLT
ncbi:MAG: hypothetical protein ACREIA_01370, partial [Opitutaceae bacterium]